MKSMTRENVSSRAVSRATSSLGRSVSSRRMIVPPARMTRLLLVRLVRLRVRALTTLNQRGLLGGVLGLTTPSQYPVKKLPHRDIHTLSTNSAPVQQKKSTLRCAKLINIVRWFSLISQRVVTPVVMQLTTLGIRVWMEGALVVHLVRRRQMLKLSHSGMQRMPFPLRELLPPTRVMVLNPSTIRCIVKKI